ncbi:MAG: hypothetical protein ABGY41_20825, partial [Candidatus Poribacteria bacterium]
MQITDSTASDHSPSWSPDGRSIAFVSFREGRQAIYVVDVSAAFPDGVANAPLVAPRSIYPEPRPSLYVLAVGVSRFAYDGATAPYAAEDAVDFGAACRRQHGEYYRDVAVRVLTDEDATTQAIRRGLHWLRMSAREGDLAVCMLSGQAVVDRAGDPYVRAYDTDPSRVAGTSVPGSDIDRLMGGVEGIALVIADLGRPGHLAGRGPSEEEFSYYWQREGPPFMLWAAGSEQGER